MGAHVATSPWGSSPLLGVPAAVEDCWPRRTGTDGFALGASGAGAKGQRGGGEKVSSAGARRFLHVLDSFRCGPDTLIFLTGSAVGHQGGEGVCFLVQPVQDGLVI